MLDERVDDIGGIIGHRIDKGESIDDAPTEIDKRENGARRIDVQTDGALAVRDDLVHGPALAEVPRHASGFADEAFRRETSANVRDGLASQTCLIGEFDPANARLSADEIDDQYLVVVADARQIRSPVSQLHSRQCRCSITWLSLNYMHEL
ncbi:hypothetical protein GCM10027344_01340 [Spelaeicoccus albus]